MSPKALQIKSVWRKKKPKVQGQIDSKGTAGKLGCDVQRPVQVSQWYPAPKTGLMVVNKGMFAFEHQVRRIKLKSIKPHIKCMISLPALDFNFQIF